MIRYRQSLFIDQILMIKQSAGVINGIQEQIILVCKNLYSKNMLAAADGNISYRLSDDEILITPSGVSKARAKAEDICIITLNGEVKKGKPSSERLMHLEVYKNCPEAKAVVHAHPPYAIAWSVAHPELKELPATCLSEVILAAGRIPFVPYARPSTLEMGSHLKPFLPDCRLMILARHGALSWGESLDEAFMGMERLEHSAQILYLSQNLKELTHLPESEVKALKEMRKKIGPKTL